MPLIINAQTNLIENGSFEQSSTHLGKAKFDAWHFSGDLVPTKVEGHNDNSGAKAYANGNYSFYVYKNSKSNIINVEGNVEYTLTFWLKGKTGEEEIAPRITWYENDTELGAVQLKTSVAATDWEQKTYVVTISPLVANKANLLFTLSSKGDFIVIDDVVLKKTGTGASVPKPTGLNISTFQREIEVSWHKGDENTKWEIVFDEDTTMLEENKYMVTNLDPGTKHTIQVRAKVGTENSEFTDEKTVYTQLFNRGKDDLMRVPHLRTLTHDGKANKTINLFYNDLYNKNAEIKYFINNTAIQPHGYQLTFPETGKHLFKVIIKEDPEHEWETEYKLQIE